MINVAFYDYEKLSSLFTVMHVVVATSFSSFMDVSIRITFLSVSPYRFSIHFPAENIFFLNGQQKIDERGDLQLNVA